MPALTKALAALSSACLLAAIVFLTIAPSVSTGIAEISCGAPALWYPDGRQDDPEVSAFPDPRTRQTSTCHDAIDTRLRFAAISFTTAILFLGLAVVAGWAQIRRMRAQWERSTRRIETGQLDRDRSSRPR